jgi:hypothetical protein
METESWHRVVARRIRALAEDAADPELKAIILRIAEQHEKIAGRLAESRLAESGRAKD